MEQIRFATKTSYFMLIACVFLTACYKPAANRTDEFANEKPGDRGVSNSALSNSSSDTSAGNAVKTETETNTMSEPIEKSPSKAEGFRDNLSQHIGKYGYVITDIVDENNSVERRLLKEYGAVFLTKAMPPSKVMFTSESEVLSFQTKAGAAQVKIGGIGVELQREAAQALVNASNEATSKGVSITPRHPDDSARRSYQHTHDLWSGRFTKACEHWRSEGKLSGEKIESMKSLAIKEQVAEVLLLETQGIYFSTNFDKSILYSVAAPGTSQHLSMLAFDAKEFGNKKVRRIMARHGWFRTVQSDAPHFTYLGHAEKELPSLGLKKVDTGDGGFWIPDV